MLLQRAVEVAGTLAAKWREAPSPDAPAGSSRCNEWSIKLLDLLSELLSGITDRESKLCGQVADLYVFLCKHLVQAEQTGDADRVDEIREVLVIETETWSQVCAQQQTASSPTPVPAPVGTEFSSTATSGLNFQA